METGADLFTIMTFQVLGSFWEKTVMPLVMTALAVGFSPRRVNDPRTRDAIANGQFILIRRAAYEAIGGHAAVHDRIVEDKAIAERVKQGGYRLIVADGMQAARTAHVHLAALHVGGLDEEHLPRPERPPLAAPAGSGRGRSCWSSGRSCCPSGRYGDSSGFCAAGAVRH